MRVLGAILRGGQSRRFGADKAQALLDGKTLLDHVIARLAAQSLAPHQTSVVMPAKAGIQTATGDATEGLDPSLRWGDRSGAAPNQPPVVMPAEAGIQTATGDATEGLDPSLRWGDGGCVAAVILCGGPAHPVLPVLSDGAFAGCGPLAGLLAALDHGAAHGFGAVLSAPCDTPMLPPDLAARLMPGPSFAAADGRQHPAIGLWPVYHAGSLRQALEAGERRVQAWAAAVGARAVAFPDPAAFANVNTPEALAVLQSGRMN